MKYQCIIVEDNAVERDLIETLLRKMQDIVIAGIFENGLEALVYLQQHTIDIAFTDVDMPELSGIGLLKGLRNPPVFIFISAHGRYAADGYDLDVLDFIRKPLSPERLFKAVHKATEYLRQQGDYTGVAEDGILMARTSEGLNKLSIEQIVYAESRANYSMLRLVDGANLLVLIGLKQLEDQLHPARFIRIHRNYLVNWKHTWLIRKDSVMLYGKYEIPIGDSYRKDLTEYIASYPSLERRSGK